MLGSQVNITGYLDVSFFSYLWPIFSLFKLPQRVVVNLVVKAWGERGPEAQEFVVLLELDSAFLYRYILLFFSVFLSETPSM